MTPTPSQVAEARERLADTAYDSLSQIAGHDGDPDLVKVRVDDVKAVLQGAPFSRTAEIKRLRAENARLKAAIAWACGEGDSDFAEKEDEAYAKPGRHVRRYWWRDELRRRALSGEDTSRG